MATIPKRAHLEKGRKQRFLNEISYISIKNYGKIASLVDIDRKSCHYSPLYPELVSHGKLWIKCMYKPSIVNKCLVGVAGCMYIDNNKRLMDSLKGYLAIPSKICISDLI